MPTNLIWEVLRNLKSLREADGNWKAICDPCPLTNVLWSLKWNVFLGSNEMWSVADIFLVL